MDESRVRNNRAYYEVLAPEYDNAVRNRYLVNEEVSLRLARQSSLESIQSVLDLGSGTGATLETVLKYTRPTSVVAVDFSGRMLELLKNKISIPGLRTVQNDIDTYLANDSTRFDLITAIGGLELVPDPLKLMATINRHMADDGLFIFTYEPQLVGMRDQSEASTTYTRELEGKTLEFSVFRANPKHVQQTLEAQKLEIVSNELVPAYPRGGSVVQYGLLVVRKPSVL